MLSFFFSKYLSLLPPAFHNFHKLLFSVISLLTFSFHHQVRFFRIPFFVHPQVFSVAESKLYSNLNQVLSAVYLSSIKFHKTYHKDQLVGASIHAVFIQMSYTNLHFLLFLHQKQVACAGLHTPHLG